MATHQKVTNENYLLPMSFSIPVPLSGSNYYHQILNIFPEIFYENIIIYIYEYTCVFINYLFLKIDNGKILYSLF